METDIITSLFIVYRYDSTTGTFTVPPGGAGFYYLSTFLLVHDEETAYFDIEFNGEVVCGAFAQQISTITDEITTSCSAIVDANEGTEFMFL